jgi:hypothetical protein
MAPEWHLELNQTHIDAVISAADTAGDDEYADHRPAYITGTAMLAMALFAGLVWCLCSLVRAVLSRCCGCAGCDAPATALCCGAEGDACDCFGGRAQPCADAEEEDEDVEQVHPCEEDTSDSAEDERTDESGNEGREEGPRRDERGNVGRGHGSPLAQAQAQAQVRVREDADERGVEVYRGPHRAAHGPYYKEAS